MQTVTPDRKEGGRESRRQSGRLSRSTSKTVTVRAPTSIRTTTRVEDKHGAHTEVERLGSQAQKKRILLRRAVRQGKGFRSCSGRLLTTTTQRVGARKAEGSDRARPYHRQDDSTARPPCTTARLPRDRTRSCRRHRQQNHFSTISLLFSFGGSLTRETRQLYAQSLARGHPSQSARENAWVHMLRACVGESTLVTPILEGADAKISVRQLQLP